MSKYNIIVIITFLILVFIISCFICSAKELALKNRIIYIDIGHGGNDPGSNYRDIKESDINLQIGLKLSKILEENGATVYMTRYDDYNLANINASNIKRSDLNNRSKLINNSDCDLYLSIHLNSYPQEIWHGAQTFYTNNNKNNKLLAQIIQENFKQKLDTNREIKLINDKYLYNMITKPGVLLELGFISNTKERNMLLKEEYQYKISNIIVDSIIKYFNTLFTNNE